VGEQTATNTPSAGRDPKERKTLEDALNVATEVVDKIADGALVDADLFVVSAGFLVLCGDMAAMLDAAKQATQFCGWCQRANGNSRVGLAAYTLDEVRDHTVRCEHNPLVRQIVAARDAARRLIEQVEHLGAFADDNDPRVMALVAPMSEAQADLWIALGLDLDAEAKRLSDDIENRCAVCGWPLKERADDGCVRGNCSMRPRPERLYAPERAKREAGR